MKFNKVQADMLVPDGVLAEEALLRTTHLGIGAHQDDLEFMALPGILECFDVSNLWFCGVTCTDGAGSARTGKYSDFTDEQMKIRRQEEQRRAAVIGRYGAMIQLNYSSSEIKGISNAGLKSDLRSIIEMSSPRVIYTHNPADKHPTHIAVFAHVINTLRSIAVEKRPDRILGCESWRGLDWLPDKDKVLLDVSERGNLSAELLGVFDSQIAGGKRYDLACLGRTRANATFLESHNVDSASHLSYAMDLTPLIRDDGLDPIEYVSQFIDRLKSEVLGSLKLQLRIS